MPADVLAAPRPLDATDRQADAPNVGIVPPNPWRWRNRRGLGPPSPQFARTCPDADAIALSDISRGTHGSLPAAHTALEYGWWRSTASRRPPCAVLPTFCVYSAFPAKCCWRAR